MISLENLNQSVAALKDHKSRLLVDINRLWINIMSIISILAIVTFIMAIISATGKCPVWLPVLLLSIIELSRDF